MVNVIGPWIKSNVSKLIVEHEDKTDKVMCNFWENSCGFIKKKIIFKAGKCARTTYVFEK